MTQRHDDPPSPSAKGARGAPIADDISHTRQRLPAAGNETGHFLSWRPLGGRREGAEKHRPLRNFYFFCLRSQKEHFMNPQPKQPQICPRQTPQTGKPDGKRPQGGGDLHAEWNCCEGEKACGSPWASRSTSSKTQAKKAISNAVPRTLVNPLVVAATGQSLSMDG